MYTHYNIALLVAAGSSALAALLHVAVIIGGTSWYRFFGAGDRMVRASMAGKLYPAVVTSGIVLVLAAWSAYALSGAGVLPALPLLKVGLVVITAVYLLRGAVLFPVLLMSGVQARTFGIWSSAICLLFGLFHLAGVVQVWSRL